MTAAPPPDAHQSAKPPDADPDDHGSAPREVAARPHVGGAHRHPAWLDDAIEAELAGGPPDETVEVAQRHVIIRFIRIVAGTLVLIAGLIFFVIPGPGLLTIALGLGLLAQDVPFARRLLERVRARLPEGENGQVKPWVIVASLLGTVLFTAGSLWFTFGRT